LATGPAVHQGSGRTEQTGVGARLGSRVSCIRVRKVGRKIFLGGFEPLVRINEVKPLKSNGNGTTVTDVGDSKGRKREGEENVLTRTTTFKEEGPLATRREWKTSHQRRIR